jgi:urease accessory protein
MDPLTVAAVTARLAAEVDEVAEASTAGLPAAADPLLDLLAEVHLARKDRFFAS